MSDLSLRRVGEQIGLDAFIDAAQAAQGSDPNWVQPLRLQIRRIFDPTRSPFLVDNETAAWVVVANDKPVGRIFAARNEAHLRRYRDETGHFGFIEGTDDPRVFDLLIGAAARWMEQRGLSRMLGPLSPSVHYEAGLLVDGFDSPPMVGLNHAPPYYERHLTRLGFSPVMDLLAIVWQREAYFPTWKRFSLSAADRIRAVVEQWPEFKDLELRTLNGRRYYQDMELVNDIYNDAWSANWGAIPLENAEARFLADLVRPLVRPQWVTFAYWRGDPIGLFVQLPNINEAIADLGGRLFPIGWAKLLWRLHVRGVKSSRIAMAGVRRAHAWSRPGTMAGLLLLADAIEKAWSSGIEKLETSWILANNRRVLNLVNTIGGRRHKTFRLFGRACRG